MRSEVCSIFLSVNNRGLPDLGASATDLRHVKNIGPVNLEFLKGQGIFDQLSNNQLLKKNLHNGIT